MLRNFENYQIESVISGYKGLQGTKGRYIKRKPSLLVIKDNNGVFHKRAKNNLLTLQTKVLMMSTIDMNVEDMTNTMENSSSIVPSESAISHESINSQSNLPVDKSTTSSSTCITTDTINSKFLCISISSEI